MPSRSTRAIAFACLLAVPAIAVAQTSDAPVEGDPVIATVDGGEIHYSDFVAAQQSLPDQYRAMPLQAIFPILLEQLIDVKLIVAEARHENLQDDEEVRERMAKIEDQVIREVYLTRHVSKIVNDDALRRHYDEFTASQPPREEISARHILVESEEDALALIAEIEEGADFAEVAKENSIGPSAARGGDIGYFTSDQMVPEFAEAAFALQSGEMTDAPVQTSFGWHVIKVEDRRPTTPTGFDVMRDQLFSELSTQAMSELIAKLRDASDIERFNIDGGSLDEVPPAAPSE